MMAIQEDSSPSNTSIDYRQLYRSLKRRYLLLLQENESFQTQLRQVQGELLQVTKDNDFLLERLMQYENNHDSDGLEEDPDATDSSGDEDKKNRKRSKKKKKQ